VARSDLLGAAAIIRKYNISVDGGNALRQQWHSEHHRAQHNDGSHQ
jgi:hypothetical protein